MRLGSRRVMLVGAAGGAAAAFRQRRVSYHSHYMDYYRRARDHFAEHDMRRGALAELCRARFTSICSSQIRVDANEEPLFRRYENESSIS